MKPSRPRTTRMRLALLRGVLGCAAAGVLLAGGAAGCRRRNPEADSLAQAPVYLDVRSHGERRRGYIPGSRHVPLNELSGRLAELQDLRPRAVLTVCGAEPRAADAAALLARSGFDRVSALPGGMQGWKGEVNGARLAPEGLAFQDRYRVGAGFVVRTRQDAHGPAGLVVETVFPGGPAAHKLQFADRVVSIDGVALEPPMLLQATVATLFPPGRDRYALVVQRGAGTFETDLQPGAQPALAVPPVPGSSDPALVAVREQVRALKAEAPELATAWLPHLRAWRPTATPLAAAALSDPANGWFLAEPLLQEIPGEGTAHEIANRVLTHAAGLLDLEEPAGRVGLPPPGPRGLVELEQAVRAGDSAEQGVRAALGPAMHARLGVLLPKLALHAFVHDHADDNLIRELYGLAAAARGVNLLPSLQAARAMLAATRALMEPGATRALRGQPGEPRPPGVSGEVLLARETPSGWLVVGGAGNNTYAGRFAAIVDVGGDDVYEFASGDAPRVLLELAGNDRYRHSGELTGDGRLAGARLVIDVAGDDHYEASGFGIAAGVLGISMVMELGGDDTYVSEFAGIGAGWWGIGAVLDLGGRDRYQGGRGTQGFGGPGGVGLLLDRGGDDRYEAVETAQADFPLVSMAQGAGAGVRELSLGGIGALLDTAGNDQYEGLEYAQGVGYFGGIGLLADRGGNDLYRARKYSQAAGVHAALGLLLESSGDDRYELVQAERGQSVAWDMGISLLLERGGNDHYTAETLAQGYAGQNGVALLVDLGGTDSYRCADDGECQGREGENVYAGGRGAGSLAVLVDK